MKTVCELNMCNGCYACQNICSQNAIILRDDIKYFNAFIDEKKCINCGACRRTCPNCSELEFRYPINCYQGNRNSEELQRSSSGGAAAAITESFINDNGVVVSCCFQNGEFIFETAYNKIDSYKFAGSKYVKSNPSKKYNEIKELLSRGQKVLFIGLPCQVAAIKLFCGNNDNLFTVDLICHGTPSQEIIRMFLKEYKIDIKEIKSILFRKKNKFAIFCDNKRVVLQGVRDTYTMAFVEGLDYSDNCFFCKFAQSKRCSDLTLGDAWGNNDEIMSKGRSIILVNTEKGSTLLKDTDLILEADSVENAIDHNMQLQKPMLVHKKRQVFFNSLNRNKSFHKSVFFSLPKRCINQNIKYVFYTIINRDK